MELDTELLPAGIRRPALSAKRSAPLPIAYSLRKVPRSLGWQIGLLKLLFYLGRDHIRYEVVNLTLSLRRNKLHARQVAILGQLGIDHDLRPLIRTGRGHHVVLRQRHDHVRLAIRAELPSLVIAEDTWRRHVRGFPCGAPPSTHFAIVSTSASVSERSLR